MRHADSYIHIYMIYIYIYTHTYTHIHEHTYKTCIHTSAEAGETHSWREALVFTHAYRHA